MQSRAIIHAQAGAGLFNLLAALADLPPPVALVARAVLRQAFVRSALDVFVAPLFLHGTLPLCAIRLVLLRASLRLVLALTHAAPLRHIACRAMLQLVYAWTALGVTVPGSVTGFSHTAAGALTCRGVGAARPVVAFSSFLPLCRRQAGTG